MKILKLNNWCTPSYFRSIFWTIKSYISIYVFLLKVILCHKAFFGMPRPSLICHVYDHGTQSLLIWYQVDHNVMPRAHRSYKLSTISFVTFGVSKLLLRNPPHTEANSFKSCKAENASSQCNRIAHALHTKDVSKLLCSTHTVRNISLMAKRRKQVA